MDYRQELKSLVELVIKEARQKGEKMNQKIIGEKMGFKNEAYISQLLTAKENVNEGHIPHIGLLKCFADAVSQTVGFYLKQKLNYAKAKRTSPEII